MMSSLLRAVPAALLVFAFHDAAAQPGETAEPEPPAPEEAEDAGADDAGADDDLGFGFGSYGRVGAATDLRGGTPEQPNIAAHGPRIGEATYAELDLYYRLLAPNGARIRTVATLAFADELFHYSGEFDAEIGIRNLFAEAVLDSGVGLWIGSRMYRGDDIYLLDYWPLDDLNTIGGGAWWETGRLYVAGHVGSNRLRNDFQFQERDVADPVLGAVTVEQLDRQRLITSAKASYRVMDRGPGALGAKVTGWAELHYLPGGERRRPEDDSIEKLPEDWGWSVGAQVGAWGFGPGKTHANAFVRLSKGLNAFDELQLPEGFDSTRKTHPDATEIVIAVSGNYEFPGGGVLAGGYARLFEDADGDRDTDDGWEYVADVRPHYEIGASFQAAVDLAYQVRFPRGLNPTTLVAEDPAVWHVAPMLVYSPFGNGSYDRPHLRLIYRAAHQNDGARNLFPLEDPRRDHRWVHYLGLQAEWWFNSTTYSR